MSVATRELDPIEREHLHALQNGLAALRLWTEELSATDCDPAQQQCVAALRRIVDETTRICAAAFAHRTVIAPKRSRSARKSGRGGRRTK